MSMSGERGESNNSVESRPKSLIATELTTTKTMHTTIQRHSLFKIHGETSYFQESLISTTNIHSSSTLTNNISHPIILPSASSSSLPAQPLEQQQPEAYQYIQSLEQIENEDEEKDVLIGTPVKEGHVNYMLMYNMLTGIRISVSRCNAKEVRTELLPEDFKSAHKLAFDVTGTELTPSAKYHFKFKDYAPWVFRGIRECFKIDPGEYLLSLTGKYVLSELGSPGKSGSFFYFSRDYRFIIKTIHHSEHKALLGMMEHYYTYVKQNPNTLLSRIFGLHRVKLPGKKKIHFVVMGNVFPANKDIHRIYDLKGSSFGRETKDVEDDNAGRPVVLKDQNWLSYKEKLYLGPIKKDLFVEQMEKDVEFLASQNIMDYSLLVGIHDISIGNVENARDSTLSIFEPTEKEIYSQKRKKGKLPVKMPKKKVVNRASTAPELLPVTLTALSKSNIDSSQHGPALSSSTTQEFDRQPSSSSLTAEAKRSSSLDLLRKPSFTKLKVVTLLPVTSDNEDEDSYYNTPRERRDVIFYQDLGGGYQSTNPSNEPLSYIYYLGIIDIFTDYSVKKKMETFLKTKVLGMKKGAISSVKPRSYAKRFLKFMKEKVL